MEACPKCGGINGYSYRRTEEYTVNGNWDGDENAEYDSIAKETKPRCIDCGKVVNLEQQRKDYE